MEAILVENILKLLEKDSRLSAKDIALMLSEKEETVQAYISALEKNKTICGYPALINWEKTDNESVAAVIEIKVNPQKGTGFDNIAKKIYQFPEVEALYLMSGAYDFLVELKKAPMKEIAAFVYNRLSVIEEVQSTATHVLLKHYKKQGTLFVDEEEDKRMVVSP